MKRVRKAVILAGGRGSRMGTLTENLPKPMLKVRGKPVLEHIVEGIVKSKIKGICIITGWKSKVVQSYFGDGKNWKTSITYLHQRVQNGTGQAAELARDFVGKDAFLLTYGDILVPRQTYVSMAHRFEKGDVSGLMATTEGEDLTKGGIGFFDDHFYLKCLMEKPSTRDVQALQKKRESVFYNAGIYIFLPIIFDFISRLKRSPRGEYELTDAIQAMTQAKHLMAGHKIEGRWFDVRDAKVLAKLESENEV